METALRIYIYGNVLVRAAILAVFILARIVVLLCEDVFKC